MEWNRFYVTFLSLFLVFVSFGQVAENHYLVYFKDKSSTPYSIYQPEAFLSERAIERRLKQNIPITEEDLPVDSHYVEQILSLGEVEVHYTLKWFNAALIETEDPKVLEAIYGLDEVVGIAESPVLDDGGFPLDYDDRVAFPKEDTEYGASFNQIDMINGLPLHAEGFKGEGIWVGVFDGGFSSAPDAAALDGLLQSDRLIGTKNFVDHNDEVFVKSSHGSSVLSTMAGVLEEKLIGTGPEASYLLCITEDVQEERRIELANWAAAAEYADSVGIDIINTSLGYTLFDVEEENFTYEDLDGNTTLITRASNIAASKGMLIVTSAGNSGNSPWYYISAPADGDRVLAVGALKPDATIASFSSRGPRVDGAVKPNVVAQGQSTVLSDLGDGIRTGNGTSFSSPIIAGMAASLWQAVPRASAEEVFRAIQESAHLYSNPNDSLGYGIPDFELAWKMLQTTTGTRDQRPGSGEILIYPNPSQEGGIINFKLPQGFAKQVRVLIFDITGQEVFSGFLDVYGDQARIQSMPRMSEGMYIVNAINESGDGVVGKMVVR